MAWTELNSYGHQAEARSDGAEQVSLRCGVLTLHLTATEAVKLAEQLREAALASQREPARRVHDRRAALAGGAA